ncbi:MAG: hypothetical protein KAT34_08610 [Candidatus Aminicenantes bacterium]|nr:hypothetical protein [Candidatus Aminicenantes bacterium]
MNLKQLNDTATWDWPENAGEFILEVLCNKKKPEPDRILAAELAGIGMVMNDNIANQLLDIIRNSEEPEELRCGTAIALGPALDWADTMEFDEYDDEMLSEKGFDEVKEQLRKIFHDASIPKKVRRRVLEAAVCAPMDWHNRAIQDAYAAKDHDWSLTAIFAMGYVPGFEDLILESLKSEDPDIYYEAVCTAGKWGLKEAWSDIEKIFTEKIDDKPLLLAAIEAAGNMAIHEPAHVLIELSDSDDEEIAEAAEDALGMAAMLSDNIPDDLLDDDLM